MEARKERTTPGVRKRVHTTADGRRTTLYYARLSYRDGTGERRWRASRGFRTKREAEAEYIRMKAAKAAGTYTAPSSMTVSAFVEQTWLPSIERQVKRSTFENYRRNWARHIKPAIGEPRLQGLTPLDLDNLYGDLSVERAVTVMQPDGTSIERSQVALKAKTIRNVHLQISKMLSDAERIELLGRNPADRANPPRVVRTTDEEIRAWDSEELRSFLRQVRDTRWFPAMRLAAMTGMRRGEVLGQRWQDIDLERRVLTVRQAVVQAGYGTYIDTPKNHRPRVIDLDPVTIKVLRQRRKAQIEARLAGDSSYLESDLVFTNDDGSLIHPDTFTQAFDRHVQAAGLRRITLHGLRHTHATLLLKAGVPVNVVSQRLGHSDPGFTLRQYAHVLPTMQAEAAAKITAMVDG